MYRKLTEDEIEDEIIPIKFFLVGKDENELLNLKKLEKDNWKVENQLLRKHGFWQDPKELNKFKSKQLALKFIKQYIKEHK